MDDLTCAVCSEVYEITVREPVILPKCGHTFCRSCLSSLQNMALLFKCPTCRAPHTGSLIANLPPVYIVLNILDKQKREKGTVNMCKTHDDPVRLWCRPCQEELCGQCLFEQHMLGHDVVRTQVAVEEMKQTIEKKAEQLTGYIKEEKSLLVQELRTIAFQLGKLYNKSQSLGNESKKIKEVLQVSIATNQMKTLARNHSLLENMIRDFSSRSLTKETYPMEDKQSLSHSTIFREKGDDQHCLEFDSNTEKEKVTEEALPDGEEEDSENYALESCDEDSDSSQDDDSQESRIQQAVSHSTESQMAVPSDVSVWPLNCHSPGGKTDWPKLSWYKFLAQVPVVQLLVPPENPEVYLQLGINGKILGRLQIRLWGHLRRAQNFLALCLGTLGPSYKGSKFSHVVKKGEPGERLVGGFYETEGVYTGYQVIEGLEWRGEYTGPMRAGVISGTKGRQAKYNSCFCISTQDYPNGKYYCPFGEVIAGLKVAQEVIQYDPINDVTVIDTGLVLPRVDL